jgi:hypothetical protein
MAARRVRFVVALFTLVTTALAIGCELVAGIENLGLTSDAALASPADGAVAGDARGDATLSQDAPGSGDTGAAGEATSDSGSSVGDASDAEASDSAADAGALDSGDAARADAGLMFELIDNMEADNGLIPKVNGRDGEWFVFNDGSDGGVETPTPGTNFLPSLVTPPRSGSMYAARMRGSGFASWGAGMGLNLNSPTSGSNVGARLTYDASIYRGFMFYGRIGAGTTATVSLSVPDHNTDPLGGVCTNACGAHFTTVLTFTTSWVQYLVYFTDLKQAAWGRPQETALDSAQIYGPTFNVGSNTTFDVWVDDIYFILR